jgi:transcriptional regulator with XRE-family HTH domain
MRIGILGTMDQRPMARFLRDRRAHLKPGDVGLPYTGRRRTVGLRREEVAELAHISASYYTRLEQARAPRPSTEVVDNLGRALRLNADERTLLFTLSGRSSSDGVSAVQRHVASSVLDLVSRLPDTAVLILDAKFDILAWNPLAAAIFDVLPLIPAGERNLIRMFFFEQDPSRRHNGVSGSQDFAGFAAGQLRAAVERYPRDPGVRTLIAELRANSTEFERLWHQVDVVAPRHQIKRLDHAVAGPLELHCNTLVIPDRDQSMVLFTAEPGTASHRALTMLSRQFEKAGSADCAFE